MAKKTKGTWKTYMAVYATVQANSFLYHLRQVPGLGSLISPRAFRYMPVKCLAGIFGIIFNTVKNIITSNISLILFIYYLPHYLNKIVRPEAEVDMFALAILFILIKCIAPAITQSRIFKATAADYSFLNHFKVKPDSYYRYKTLQDFILSGLFLAPGLIYVFRSGPMVVFLLLTKLFFMGLGHVFFLSRYRKKGKLLGVNKRLLLSTILILLTYLAFALGLLNGINIAPAYFIPIMAVEGLLLLACWRYLIRFEGYKRIAVEFANKDVVGLKVAVVSTLTEEDTGLTVSDWEENRAYFNANKEKDMGAYMDTAFRHRYKKAFRRQFLDQFYLNLFLCLLLGVLIRFDIVTLNRANILEYSPMIISIVLGLTFSDQYLQMCFRHLDRPMLYYRFSWGAKLAKNIMGRFSYLIRRAFLMMLVIVLGLLILLWFGQLHLAWADFAGLSLIYFLIYVLYETSNLVMYYLVQPYTVDLTVKNPVFSLFKKLQGLFAIGVLFARSNVLDLAVPLAISLAVMAVIFLITLRLAPKTFRLRTETVSFASRKKGQRKTVTTG